MGQLRRKHARGHPVGVRPGPRSPRRRSSSRVAPRPAPWCQRPAPGAGGGAGVVATSSAGARGRVRTSRLECGRRGGPGLAQSPLRVRVLGVGARPWPPPRAPGARAVWVRKPRTGAGTGLGRARMPRMGARCGRRTEGGARWKVTALKWVGLVPSFWRNRLNLDIEGIFPTGINLIPQLFKLNSSPSETNPGYSSRSRKPNRWLRDGVVS